MDSTMLDLLDLEARHAELRTAYEALEAKLAKRTTQWLDETQARCDLAAELRALRTENSELRAQIEELDMEIRVMGERD